MVNDIAIPSSICLASIKQLLITSKPNSTKCTRNISRERNSDFSI